jgi:vacuolar-type H+-ATPase subunit I/STV1
MHQSIHKDWPNLVSCSRLLSASVYIGICHVFMGYLAVLAMAFLELWIWVLYQLIQSSHLCVSIYGC